MSAAFGQTASISGRVTDASGASVPSAHVRLTGPVEQTTKTDVQGDFRFYNLPLGVYRLVIQSPGFAVADRQVRVGARPVRVAVELKLAVLEERITVPAENAGDRLTGGSNADRVEVSPEELKRLPVLGGDVLGTLSALLPPGSLRDGTASVIVDGVEVARPRLSPRQIAEMKINAHPYSAEFSRPGRGRIEIRTNAGTEKYHGSLTGELRDSALDARNPFALSKPSERRLRWEAAFSGPLPWMKRSRRSTFMMGIERESATLSSLVLARTPIGETRENVPRPERELDLSLAAQSSLGPNLTWTLRYQAGRDKAENQGVGGFRLAETAYTSEDRDHEVQLSLRATANPRWLSESLIRLERDTENTFSLTRDAPLISVDDAFVAGGAQADRSQRQTQLRLAQILSYSAGRHAVRFGVQAPIFTSVAQNDQTNRLGVYSFSTIEDYLARTPYAFDAQRGDGRLRYRQSAMALFVQDEMRLRANVQLSLGLRWEWQNALDDRNNFSPRVALAWSPGKKNRTILRFGSGIFHESLGGGVYRDTLLLNGLRLRQVLVSDPIFPLPDGYPLDLQPANLVRYGPGLRSPYLWESSGGIEQYLRDSLSISLTYRETRGVSFFRSRDVNAPFDGGSRPDPSFARIREVESAGRRSERAIEAALRGKIGKVFTGNIQATYGRMYSNTEGAGWLPADSYRLEGEWGRANDDTRFRLQAAGSFDLADWVECGLIFRAQSAAPYTLTTGRDDNGDGSARDRPPGVARNTLAGRAGATLDARVSREFELAREGLSLRLSVDAFNVVNRVNYASFVGNISSPFFGQPVSARPARRMQVAIELEF